jgi:AraC-like DNA-binding protein
MTDSDLCAYSVRAKFSSIGAIVMAYAQPTLPAVQVLYLAELVRRWNVSVEALLAGSGVSIETLSDPAARLDVPTVVGIAERARALTGEPALGYYLGLQMRLSMHGYLGFAAWSAPTARAAAELMVQFVPIVTTALALRLRVDGCEASILVEEHADFGSARDIVLLAVLIAVWRIGARMTGQSLTGYADLAMPEPGYFARLGPLGARVRFDQPVTRLVFDASYLAQAYRMHDPVALQFARRDCAQTLDAVEGAQPTVARVRGLLNVKRGCFPSVVEAAASLHLSTRTLKRQLAAEGTSFSLLIQEERRERSMLLLRSRSLSIKDVARSVGYSNVMNFVRAFHRWTGQTPGQHRQSLADRSPSARVA